jgi:hypothetical protein
MSRFSADTSISTGAASSTIVISFSARVPVHGRADQHGPVLKKSPQLRPRSRLTHQLGIDAFNLIIIQLLLLARGCDAQRIAPVA